MREECTATSTAHPPANKRVALTFTSVLLLGYFGCLVTL